MTASQPAHPATYLQTIRELARQRWPHNRYLTIVCHGHSVPAGYFKTPRVRPMDSYPHLLRCHLAQKFPHAVINVIVTAIGGENSRQGARRFKKEVLNHRPDVVTIDYSLNDRALGLRAAHTAWTRMILAAKGKGAKVILLTPSADLAADLEDRNDPLHLHARQVRELAEKHGVGLSDSLAAFVKYHKKPRRLSSLMSHSNHPNRKGHEQIAANLRKWF